MKFDKIYRSGRVIRWHSNPDMSSVNQNNAEHQWGVAIIVLKYFPDASKELLTAALLHDAGEIDAGDMSGPAKKKHQKLKELLDVVESESLKEMGIKFNITDRESSILRWADRYEAYLTAQRHNPRLLEEETWKSSKIWIDEELCRIRPASYL